VVGARVVLLDGTVKDFSGPELDLIAEAEGITGLVSRVTIRVQPREKLDVMAISCPEAHDVQRLLQSIVDEKLPIWSVLFINPRMADLRNKAPQQEHYGHYDEEKVLLPVSYIVILAFRSKDSQNVTGKLPGIMEASHAERLSDEIAEHEWKNRFKLMVVKRLGPSLVPAEVVVPLKSLGDFMTDVENLVSQPLVKEGVLIREGKMGEPEVVILGFIPSDQRRFSYNFVFPLSLTVAKLAEKHGGRPFSTGLYFSGKAREVLGEEKVRKLKEFKSKVDPKNILNPGKVIGNGLISSAVKLAGTFEWLVRPAGNRVAARVGERPTGPVRDIPADVAWYAYACSQCGYCVDECDQFYGRGWESQSPRGKWYWLREYMEGREEWDQSMVDTIMDETAGQADK